MAHRGSSGSYAEHTLEAYRAALDEGADALECDVRMTRDGVLVCVHDRRVDRTSDGRGLVSTLELADLAELDWRSWKSGGSSPLAATPAAPARAADSEEPDRDAGGVLTLERLLHLVLDCRRPVQLQIETKHPTRHGARVERALVDLLERYWLAAPDRWTTSRVAVVSYSLRSLRRVQALAPRLPTVLNTDYLLPWLRDGALPRGVWAVGAALRLVRSHPGYVRRVHGRGGRVHVFTADRPADVDFLLHLGVDAIITNRPEQVRARLPEA